MAVKLFPRSSFLRLFLLAISLGMVQLQTGCGGNDDNPIVLIPVSVTISGVVTYEDKEYGESGFTGTLMHKQVRFAGVEAVSGINVLASASTDASGAYNLSYTTYVGVPVKLRVIANAGPTGSTVAEVRNLRGQVYAVSVSVLSSTVNISIPVSSPAGGAFNILDVLTSGAEFVNSLAGSYPPEVVAFWEASSPNGTYYCTSGCPPGAGIYIIGHAGGDTDGYDDDVIWHEYGHFIAEKYSRDDSPGGVHALGQNNLDLRLAWSEGWGDFILGAVKSWLGANSPDLLSSASTLPLTAYADTNIGGWSFDFGDPGGDPYIYSSSEVAVAKVLHDLRNGFGMTAVWGVVDGYIQTVTTPTNLEAFWDGWYSIYNGDAAAMASAKGILNGRSIFYELDAFEPDDTIDTAQAAALPVSELHYLYQPGSDDHDFVSFSANAGQPYTVSTADLKNRVYPIITAYRADKTTIIASGFNSIPVTPSVTETVYIEVKPYPARPASYGRYGTYTLTIHPQ